MIDLDINLSQFELIVSEIEPIKCESTHASPKNKTCSKVATHILTTKHRQIIVCEKQASYSLGEIMAMRRCSACVMAGNSILCRDCWEITPL